MNKDIIEKTYGIKIKSKEELINKLKLRITTYEFVHRKTSEEIISLTKQDPSLETADTCAWIQDYTLLKKIGRQTDTVGTPMIITKQYMTSV